MRLFRHNTMPSASGETEQTMDAIERSLLERGLGVLTPDDMVVITSGTKPEGATTLMYHFTQDETGARWPVMKKVYENNYNKTVTDYMLSAREARMVTHTVVTGRVMGSHEGDLARSFIAEQLHGVEVAIRDTEGNQTVVVVPNILPEQLTDAEV